MGGRWEWQFFPSNFSCLTVPKIFVGQPFSVSLISGIIYFYASESYITIFCRIFLTHIAEKTRRGTLLYCVSENFRYRIELWTRRCGEYQNFPSKIFCLTVLRNFVGQPFQAVFQKTSGGENFMDKKEGEVSRFVLKIFCLNVPKNAVGDPLVFH